MRQGSSVPAVSEHLQQIFNSRFHCFDLLFDWEMEGRKTAFNIRIMSSSTACVTSHSFRFISLWKQTKKPSLLSVVQNRLIFKLSWGVKYFWNQAVAVIADGIEKYLRLESWRMIDERNLFNWGHWKQGSLKLNKTFHLPCFPRNHLVPKYSKNQKNLNYKTCLPSLE